MAFRYTVVCEMSYAAGYSDISVCPKGEQFCKRKYFYNLLQSLTMTYFSKNKVDRFVKSLAVTNGA